MTHFQSQLIIFLSGILKLYYFNDKSSWQRPINIGSETWTVNLKMGNMQRLNEELNWGRKENQGRIHLPFEDAGTGISCFIAFHFIVLSCSVMSNSLGPHDCSPPGTSVHWIIQERILEWVAISTSRGSAQLRDRTLISCVSTGKFFIHWAIREVPALKYIVLKKYYDFHKFKVYGNPV